MQLFFEVPPEALALLPAGERPALVAVDDPEAETHDTLGAETYEAPPTRLRVLRQILEKSAM